MDQMIGFNFCWRWYGRSIVGKDLELCLYFVAGHLKNLYWLGLPWDDENRWRRVDDQAMVGWDVNNLVGTLAIA